VKLTFKKDAALQCLTPLQSVIGAKTMLPILAHVVFEVSEGKVWVIGSDLEMWITCHFPAQVEGKGSITIPGRRLFSVIRELPGQEAVMEVQDDGATVIRSQRSYFRMLGLSKDEFPGRPDLANAVEVSIQQKELARLVRQTSYASAQDDDRRTLSGILFSFAKGILTTVATDGRRLSLAQADCEMPADLANEVILPLKTVVELAKILKEEGDIKIVLGSHQVAFITPSVQIFSRQLEGRFPGYQQVIPAVSRLKIVIPREEFMAVVKRVSLLTSENSPSVKFSFESGKVEVSTITPEVGEAREELNIAYDGSSAEIAFNPHFINDVLKNLEEDEMSLELNDSNSPGVIRTDGKFLAIIMPIKLA